ncbi:uncharacterized mitochondrial protein AtMg00810-like [Aristolochia californica]|uniref:uncharacterized mitochondrial protein AtMg00810-like n=1 Tax=Aristolochia californica TaxID=171875 RepID=UPI0035D5F3E9
MDSNTKLYAGSGEDMDTGKYQRLVGKLLTLNVTRSDISYVVRKGLLHKKHGHFNIEGFTDVDRANSPNDRKSTSGYCALFGGNLVTWRSKKQNVVARSSVEVEYRDMTHTVSELLWIDLNKFGFYKGAL